MTPNHLPAWWALLESLRPALSRLARGRDVEDLLQETAARLLQAVERSDASRIVTRAASVLADDQLAAHEEEAKSYIVATARSILADRARKSKRRPTLDFCSGESVLAEVAVPQKSDTASAASEAARAILAELPVQSRRMIEMRYLHEMPLREISIVLARKREAIKSECSRTLARMRDRYKSFGDFE